MNDKQKLPMPQDAAADHASQSELPPNADVEERFNDFWKRNGPSIFAVIAIVAVITVGYEIYGYIQARNAEKLSETFASLQSPEEKMDFATAHPNTELGGLAYLELADQAYAAGNFPDAATRYEAAVKALDGTPIAGRARLGAAMAKLRLGDATAPALLDQIARDPAVLAPIRGEAAYLLATARWKTDNPEEVRRALDLLATIEGAGVWQSLGLQLESQIPELAASGTGE